MNEKKCPHQHPAPTLPHQLKPGLPPLTDRLKRLPIDARGYPVPFFVAYVHGEPEFRLADPEKRARCIMEDLCWVCGEPLGKFKTFPIGPMCAVNRNTAEPPSHLDCSEWSVKGCPFLSRPNMVRREDELTEANKGNIAGIPIYRNPGVICLWSTRHYRLVRDHARGALFSIGDPTCVTWWREGREATLAEVEESINSGLPFLLNVCADPEERQEVFNAVARVKPWLPGMELPI